MPLVSRPATNIFVAAQLAVFLLASAIFLPAVTPSEAIAGGLWLKLAFLVRMAALVALAHWMLHKRSLGWSDVGLRQPHWWRFLVALPAGALLTILFAAGAHAVVAPFGLPLPSYAMFAPIRGNLGEYLFWVLPVSIGTAAIGEELIFRGFIADALRRLCGGGSEPLVFVIALTAQAVIFGSLHFYQGVSGIITAGATGLALGLTWLIAGRNLWAGIALHALLDGSAMTAIYLGYVTTG